ncbi:MAG TPA: transglycosylase domain-containing protein [Kofleriaceae bacterium]|nr:transglycosylase domain-containing protein [Kofleriaceae bacterium]
MEAKAKPDKLQKAVPAKRRPLWLSLLKWAGIMMVAGIVLGVSTIAFVLWMYGRDPNLPDPKKLEDYHFKQSTKVLDRNDHLIGTLGEHRRTFVPYDKIPPIVIDAFVAAEDNKFWSHGGVDYVGMMRAFIANLRAGHTKEGASTITQQVVKNMLLTSARTFKRKVQEIILARRLEKSLTKQEIITLYVNDIDFGRSRYGVEEAALYYFGKHIQDVNVGEAALLASLPKSPESFGRALIAYRDRNEVTKTLQDLKGRQSYVLGQLVTLPERKGPVITAAEAQKWREAKVQIVKRDDKDQQVDSEWVDLVKTQLLADKTKGEGALDQGTVVRTTLDPALQAEAQKALQAGLRAVDARHKIGRAIRTVKPDKLEAELQRLAKKMKGEVLKAKTPYDAIVTAVHDDDEELEVDLGATPAIVKLGDEADARFNPDQKKPSERFKIGDVLEVWTVPGAVAKKQGKGVDDEDDRAAPVKLEHGSRRVQLAPGPEGAVVILDVKTRKVRALVGGYSTHLGDYNRATMAKRQAGSSFKPLIYTAAYARAEELKCHANDPTQKQVCGTPASIVNDAPEQFDLWKPKNFETGEYLGPVRLRDALAKSINTVSIRITSDLKPETVVAMAHKLGIKSELPAEMSLSLGAGEVTPLELTNAYATLASGGLLAEPTFIDAIDGKAQPQAKGEQVITPEVAYVMTDTMRSVVTEGTAAMIGAKLKVPISGKTGTSNDAKDTWFIGMTPDYVIGVWCGYDDPREMKGEQGARVAAPVFLDIAKDMNLPGKAFVRPAHVVEAVIDRQTGLLAPEGAPKNTTLTEVFVEGTAPTEVAPKPGEVTEGSSVTNEYGD